MNFIWAFKFTNAIDSETKQPIPVDVNNYTSVSMPSSPFPLFIELICSPQGLTTAPNPFKCQITPRSPAHVALIEKGMKEAREIFRGFEVLDKLYEPED